MQVEQSPWYFMTVPVPTVPVGGVLPCVFIDQANDTGLTIAAAIPDDGSRWSIDVATDDNGNKFIDPAEVFGATASFIQEKGQIRMTISDMRSRPPGTARFFRARRVT